MNDSAGRGRSGSIRIIYQGFGPAYGGDEFVRLKEIPPAVVAARASGRWLLCLFINHFPFELIETESIFSILLFSASPSLAP